MNRKRLVYILLSVIFIILIAVVMIYPCLSQKADIRTSAPAQENPFPSSITDVTEYIAASELTDEASLTAAMQEEVKTNPCTDLSVPTYITKVSDTYFIVDCYHNQVIYHDNLDDPLYEWRVMTDEIKMGHTLASDGSVYLVDDTENNRILVFEKREGRFLHTQTFSDIGNRPHYIIYDENTDTFYAWSSMSGEMYLFRHNTDDARMYLTEIRRIEALSNVYVRSFTILDGDIYFVSGNSSIIRADLNTFEILDSYPVPDTMAGMIQLTKIQDYFYLTISTDITGNQDYATIIRTKKLSNLIKGKYEDIYENFIGGGTPYYITHFDGSYFLTEHRLPGHSIWRFRVVENELSEVQTIY
ncbi:MAG: hypothetical protein NC321_04175 [Clostridium sp.]|nr:hypothetical protein [Clostridium sp.]